MDEDIRFEDTKFCVEADSFARLKLWQEWHKPSEGELKSPREDEAFTNRNRIEWEQDCLGFIMEIGQLDGRPVVVEGTWAKLNGNRVFFYHSCSQVVDHEMVREWFKGVCAPRWDAGSRLAQTDANNFHHCIHYLEDEKRR